MGEITLRKMRDITFCSTKDCPSEDCRVKLTNNEIEAGEIVSIADFSGECRYYIGWLLSLAGGKE